MLNSPKFPVEPFAYYRIRLLAKGTDGGHWAVSFLDADGKEIVADVYDAIDPAPAWRRCELCFRGHADARTAQILLRRNYNSAAAAPLEVKNLRVDKITGPEAAAWAAGLAAQCPVVRFEPAADRWRHIPKSMAKLVAGERLRIVMLGDSICNDTSNSLYETLLAERYPGARIEVVTSVRGGTGCTYYKDENRVQSYVLDYRPDLAIIAGISHDFDVEAMRSVVRQIRAGSGCEILVLTGAVAPWHVLEPAFLKDRTAGPALDQMEQFDGALAEMCRAEQVEFFDVRRVWDEYLRRSHEPYAARPCWGGSWGGISPPRRRRLRPPTARVDRQSRLILKLRNSTGSLCPDKPTWPRVWSSPFGGCAIAFRSSVARSTSRILVPLSVTLIRCPRTSISSKFHSPAGRR
jgi:hypothetical protein